MYSIRVAVKLFIKHERITFILLLALLLLFQREYILNRVELKQLNQVEGEISNYDGDGGEVQFEKVTPLSKVELYAAAKFPSYNEVPRKLASTKLTAFSSLTHSAILFNFIVLSLVQYCG